MSWEAEVALPFFWFGSAFVIASCALVRIFHARDIGERHPLHLWFILPRPRVITSRTSKGNMRVRMVDRLPMIELII